MILPAACRQLNVPWRLTSTTACQVSSGRCSVAPCDLDAGVVDDQVEPAVICSDGGEDAVDGDRVTHVELAVGDRGRAGHGVARIEVRGDDGPSLLGEPRADRPADPTSTAGDDRNASHALLHVAPLHRSRRSTVEPTTGETRLRSQRRRRRRCPAHDEREGCSSGVGASVGRFSARQPTVRGVPGRLPPGTAAPRGVRRSRRRSARRSGRSSDGSPTLL